MGNTSIARSDNIYRLITALTHADVFDTFSFNPPRSFFYSLTSDKFLFLP